MAENTNGTTPPPAAPGGDAPAPGAAAAQEEQRLRGVSRSLVIAVGGTGHKILLDVRQRLLQRYGSLDRLPIVSFLLIA